MNMQYLRHVSRYVINTLALTTAVLGLPEWAPFNLPQLAGVAAVLNTVLSLLKQERPPLRPLRYIPYRSSRGSP